MSRNLSSHNKHISAYQPYIPVFSLLQPENDTYFQATLEYLNNRTEYLNLTPANQRCQTPGQRVKPDAQDGQRGSAFGVPLDGLQRFGDDQVAIDRDGQQVYHRGDAKQCATECIYFTS